MVRDYTNALDEGWGEIALDWLMAWALVIHILTVALGAVWAIGEMIR